MMYTYKACFMWRSVLLTRQCVDSIMKLDQKSKKVKQSEAQANKPTNNLGGENQKDTTWVVCPWSGGEGSNAAKQPRRERRRPQTKTRGQLGGDDQEAKKTLGTEASVKEFRAIIYVYGITHLSPS